MIYKSSSNFTVLSDFRKSIANGTFDNNFLTNSLVIPDGEKWHWIEFEPFDLVEEMELEFEFKDVDNESCKKGMQFNFIELRLLASGKSIKQPLY